MSLASYVSRRLVSELALRTLRILSSISTHLSDDQLRAAVDQGLASLPAFVVRENNELGILVKRVTLRAAQLVEQGKDEEGAYLDARAGDNLVEQDLHELAHRIGGVFSMQIRVLRASITDEVEALVGAVRALVPQLAGIKNAAPAIVPFTWGRLEDQSYLSAALLNAKEKTQAFSTGDFRQCFTDTLLGRLDSFQATDAGDDLAAARQAVAAALPAEVPEAVRDEFASVVTNARAFARFAGDVRYIVTGNATTAGVLIPTIQKVAQFDRLLEALLTREDLSAVLGPIASVVITNLQALQEMLLFMNAAFLNQRETVYKDALILPAPEGDAAIYVNAAAYKRFVDAGGRDEDIQTHAQWRSLIKLVTPAWGVPLGQVLDTRDDARDRVNQDAATRLTSAQSEERDAMVKAVTRVLDDFIAGFTGSAMDASTLQATHQALRDRAASLAAKDGTELYGILTDYLVAIRGNPLLTKLHERLRPALLELGARGNPAITPDMTAAVFCTVIAEVLGGFLVERFGAPAE